ITERTQHPKIKPERLTAQIIEAAEQCERLDMPALHPAQKLKSITHSAPIYAGLERGESSFINTLEIKNDSAFLIGPVGGFTDDEIAFIRGHNNMQPFSLGERVYRVETAAILCLSYAALKNG
ncbi:MAG: RsmE family RNA methyltransferase, partial [Bacteroidota bacterium]